MSRLSRYTQLIFGSSAGNNQIAEFGSLYANAKATYSGSTITPAIVQTLSNYLVGWFNAAIGSNSPAIEDMNALCYLFAYQLAYILQVGVPEWDSGTTYYTGDIVSSSGTLYVSLQNTNLNNAVTNASYWGALPQNGIVTPNTMPASTTVTSGNTLTWPNLTIPNGDTLTVNSGANFVGAGPLIVSGTLINSGTVRVF